MHSEAIFAVQAEEGDIWKEQVIANDQSIDQEGQVED